MPTLVRHRVIAADRHRVPPPFLTFAVRSDEPPHGSDARAPYGGVHQLQTRLIDAAAIAGLMAAGHAGARTEAFSDITYANTQWPALAAAAPAVGDLCRGIAGALQLTGVLGTQRADYERHLAEARVDFLAARGAGFHNDVGRHWARCLFWLLALDVAEVEFVMPHAGVCIGLAPGDLLLFDPAMAHGLCRPGDAGQALAASFEGGANCRQLFLTGELLLSDAQWAALGCPWLPVQAPAHRGALDLALAQFDDRTGAIQRLSALRHCMQGDAFPADDAPGGASERGPA